MFELMGKKMISIYAHKVFLSGPMLKVYENISTFGLVHVFAYKLPYMKHISLTKCTNLDYIELHESIRWIPVFIFPRFSLKQRFLQAPCLDIMKLHENSYIKLRPLVKSACQKNNFRISQPKHMLWVLKNSLNGTVLLSIQNIC